MKFDLSDFLYALSFALDAVEQEILGIRTNHGKGVAYIVMQLGKKLGFQNEELNDLVGCAILHDNALAESIQDEFTTNRDRFLGIDHLSHISSRHCIVGESNLQLVPFHTDVSNVILYHHENADGSGPLGKTAEEVDIKAQLIHIADIVDMGYDLDHITREEFCHLLTFIETEKDHLFSSRVVQLFQETIQFDVIEKMQIQGPEACLREGLPSKVQEYTEHEVRNLAAMFAEIVDYKSAFTGRHSMGVAKKADYMSRYYQFPKEKALRFYFAAALHDIGKLVITNDILEKPGKLDQHEFHIMKNHAQATCEIFRKIKEMDDIAAWAAHHHEKLDGSGYPFGLCKEQLSKEERLMTCIDIYQALSEERPYKKALKHEEAILLMREMAKKGEIDGEIVEDINKTFL